MPNCTLVASSKAGYSAYISWKPGTETRDSHLLRMIANGGLSRVSPGFPRYPDGCPGFAGAPTSSFSLPCNRKNPSVTKITSTRTPKVVATQRTVRRRDRAASSAILSTAPSAIRSAISSILSRKPFAARTVPSSSVCAAAALPDPAHESTAIYAITESHIENRWPDTCFLLTGRTLQLQRQSKATETRGSRPGCPRQSTLLSSQPFHWV